MPNLPLHPQLTTAIQPSSERAATTRSTRTFATPPSLATPMRSSRIPASSLASLSPSHSPRSTALPPTSPTSLARPTTPPIRAQPPRFTTVSRISVTPSTKFAVR
ncbi:hypothetical protein AHAS_Ahas13G0239700 [Arachis hypogaea]